MTDEEYKKIAVSLLLDLRDQDISDANITNIGELFFERIANGLGNLNEPTSKPVIIKEYKSIDKIVDKFIEEKILVSEKTEEDEFYQSIYLEKDREMCMTSFVMGLNHAVQKWENFEDILLGFGIENPKNFIASVKKAYQIKDIKKRYEKERSLINQLLKCPKSDYARNFLFYVIFEAHRNSIINFFKDFRQNILMEGMKYCKYLGEKYPDVYRDRAIYYSFLRQEIGDDINKIFNYIDKNGLTDLYTSISSRTFEELHSKNGDNWFFNRKRIPFYVDFIFGIYHIVYKNPQFLVKLAFFLMSDKMSAQMQKAMYNSFAESDYNTLIQYEYEWWCKETGQTLNIPFPFSTEQFDKNNTTIVDYDLDKLKYGPNMLVNAPEPIKDIEYHEPDDYVTRQTPSVHVGEKQILDNLEPFIIKYVPAKERFINGNSITDYMEDIIALSKTIKDSYNAYGFAYILFHSRFLKWNEMPFNIQFVETIISMFDIHIPENKMKDGHILNYEHKDAKRCAKKLLTPRESLRHFLNKETLKAIDW